MYPSRRYASALIVLLVPVAVMFAGCGSSSATTNPPSVAGMWTGRFLDYEDPARPYEAGLVYLNLEQSGNGQLSGVSKMCGGVFGIHVLTNNASGTVNGSLHVHLDIDSFHLDGTYSTRSYRHISLEGKFSSPNAVPPVQKAIALTLLPASDIDYALGCAQTPTASP